MNVANILMTASELNGGNTAGTLQANGNLDEVYTQIDSWRISWV
jgi:hypothetical protein